MKVLHVISDTNIGGAGVLLCNLLFCFDRTAVSSIVALPNGSQLATRLKTLNIPLVYLHEPCDCVSLKSIWELSHIMKSNNIDIVHANAALSARMAARVCHIPVVHTRHCCFPPKGLLTNDFLRRTAGVCNRLLSDYVIATAEVAAKNLRELGISEDKIRVIINGSLPVCEVEEETLEETREFLGIQKEDFTVGICARLEACKGHDTFLDAAIILRQLRPDFPFRFLIIGDGSRLAELQKLCADFHLNDCVIFTGFVADMAPIYRILRVNVNCSCGTETSCLAISEGMSVGLPTVASDYGGNVAMIGESDAGILFPVGDAEALASAILQIAEDAELEKRMKEAAHERYFTHFTAAKMSREVQDVYEMILGKEKSRS